MRLAASTAASVTNIQQIPTLQKVFYEQAAVSPPAPGWLSREAGIVAIGVAVAGPRNAGAIGQTLAAIHARRVPHRQSLLPFVISTGRLYAICAHA